MGVLLLAASAGCANKYEQNHMSSSRPVEKVVAVMPFQGVSESPGSGLIVADVMANELYARGGYVVVTPEVVAARAAAREGEVLSPEATGRLIGTPYILAGRVTEYTYKSGVGEQPAVAVTARLIETATGRVLWSATRARTGSAAWFQEDSLGLLTARICRDLVQSFHGEVEVYGYRMKKDEFTVQDFPLTPSRADAPLTIAPTTTTTAPRVDVTVSGVAPTSQASVPYTYTTTYPTSSSMESPYLYSAPPPAPTVTVSPGYTATTTTPGSVTVSPSPSYNTSYTTSTPSNVTVSPVAPDMPPITVTVTLEHTGTKVE